MAVVTVLEEAEVFGVVTVGTMADLLECGFRTLENVLPRLEREGVIARSGRTLVLASSLPDYRPDTCPEVYPEVRTGPPRTLHDTAPNSGNGAIDTNNTNSADVLLGVGGVGGGVFKALELDVKDVDLELQDLKSKPVTQEPARPEKKLETFAAPLANFASKKTPKPKPVRTTARSIWDSISSTAPERLDATAWDRWITDLDERTGDKRFTATTGRLEAQAIRLIDLSSKTQISQADLVSEAIQGCWQSFHVPRAETNAGTQYGGTQRTVGATRRPRTTDEANTQLQNRFNRITSSLKGITND